VMPDFNLKVGVMGAGAVGLYVGGKLAAKDVDVVFVGRSRVKTELEASGLRMTDLDGASQTLAREKIVFETDPAKLADRDVVLCCVKSAQTSEVAEPLATVLSPSTVVVSLQNGVRNADALRSHLKGMTVLGGIVGFNVVPKGPGVFRRTTSGPLVIESSQEVHVQALAGVLGACGFDVKLAADIGALQWGKLMMNLNNAVSALSGVPTRELLFTEGYRKVLAAIIAESLAVLRAASIRPASLTPLPVGLFPFVLRLPTPVLRILLRTQLKIDPEARSSMWEDLSKRRPTEVDYLNGEIVRLAKSLGRDAPLNRRIVEIVHDVEKRQQGSPGLTAEVLWRELSSPSKENPS
jgi:2-dehydropantoate 2-reductase